MTGTPPTEDWWTSLGNFSRTDNVPSRRTLEGAGFELEREERGLAWYALAPEDGRLRARPNAPHSQTRWAEREDEPDASG